AKTRHMLDCTDARSCQAQAFRPARRGSPEGLRYRFQGPYMTTRMLSVGAAMLAVVTAAAQSTSDPRVGLKAGLHDAGEAIRGLERVASLSNPAGFFDPKQPAGT